MMTITTHKMQVLSGPERRRRWSTAEKLAIIQGNIRAGRDGEHRRASARHPAEPVVRLAQAGVTRCADGDGHRRGGCRGIRLPGASELGSGPINLI